MPQHYSPERKAEVLQVLQANGGNITATHRATGVPVRTLYSWRQELYTLQLQQQHTLLLPPPPPQLSPSDPDADPLLSLRDTLLHTIEVLSTHLSEEGPHTFAHYMDVLQTKLMLVDNVIRITRARQNQ